jgi:hypothetical protein
VKEIGERPKKKEKIGETSKRTKYNIIPLVVISPLKSSSSFQSEEGRKFEGGNWCSISICVYI